MAAATVNRIFPKLDFIESPLPNWRAMGSDPARIRFFWQGTAGKLMVKKGEEL
jgi:hypothetical protein